MHNFVSVTKNNLAYKYIIIARGPISRVISAFNWRYKLVVESKSQKNKSYELLKLLKQVKSYFYLLLMIDRMFQNHLSFRLLKILHNFKIHHKKRSVTLIYPYLKNHKWWYISTYMWCEERGTVRECF